MKKLNVIIIALIGFALLFACKDKQPTKTDFEIVKELTVQWNNAMANHKIDLLSMLYADSVKWGMHGEKGLKNIILAEKLRLFNQYPDFRQSIIDSISVSKIDSNYYTTFIKRTMHNNSIVEVETYLWFEKINGKWLITQENDELIEQQQLNEQQAKLKAEQEAEYNAKSLQFEQKVTLSGKLGTTNYHDASGNKFTVYILTLDNPINVGTPNKNYDAQSNVKEIQVGFEDDNAPLKLIGKHVTLTGEIYGEETIHDRRHVVMIHAVVQK